MMIKSYRSKDKWKDDLEEYSEFIDSGSGQTSEQINITNRKRISQVFLGEKIIPAAASANTLQYNKLLAIAMDVCLSGVCR